MPPKAYRLPQVAEVKAWWASLSGLAHLALYFLGVEILLLATRALSAATHLSTGDSLGGWVRFLAWVCGILFLILGWRWFRRKLMWRLRNRLIVTYTFIGVIPVVLLLAMAVIAAYLFAGQFATFVATSDIQAELKMLGGVNARLSEQIAANIQDEKRLRTIAERFRHAFPGGHIAAWQGDKPLLGEENLVERGPAGSLDEGKDLRALVLDQNGTWLRVAQASRAGAAKLTVVSSVPFNKELLEKVAAGMGELVITNVATRSPEKQKPKERRAGAKSRLVIGDEEFELNRAGTEGSVSAGVVPPPRNRWDRGVSFLSTLPVLDWSSGENRTALMTVQTRPSLLYGRLFRTIGQFADFILLALIAIAIFFAVIELLALFIGVRLTRTMTGSVAALYHATQHINKGELSHRIEVKSDDQLADLERSFNSMTESLQKLIAEQKEKQRLESELAIAQEVQAQLFPKQGSELDTLEVHGFCRPARTVSGDYYDFLHLGPQKLAIAVGDISGKGISAALLMATIHSAVRAYEFGRMPERQELVAAGAAAAAFGSQVPSTALMASQGIESPADVLWLLNRHLYHSTPPEKYATLFLALYDEPSRRLTYSNAGHLPPIIMGSDGSTRKLDTGGMVIGLFDSMSYEERCTELRPGDMFVAYSDGITEPENEFGEFGEERLMEIVREHRHLPLARISEAVTAAVTDWIAGGEQPDDVTLVLARAR